MASSVSCGYPLYVDGAYYPAALLRSYDGGISVYDTGTAAAVGPAAGVFGTANMTVAAGTGMTVLVAAGYCSIPNAAGSGAYRFGLMQQATLTVASNSTGSTRKDLVIANVQDLGSSSSGSQVQYLTGTTSLPTVPSNAIVLAEIDVPTGVSSILPGYITDKRKQVVPPGCLIPISSLVSAPVVPTGTLMYDTATGQIIYSPYTVITEELTGSGTYYFPNGTTSTDCQEWASGAGGTSNGSTGSGGGGGAGEWAREPNLAVVAGVGYPYSCGAGGQGGSPGTNVSTGADTTFQGATATVHAHAGQATAGSQAGGTGGAGSTNSQHANGGAGGSGDNNTNGYGGGGGAAGSPAGAGQAGNAATDTSPGTGGTGQDGAGSGGNGGGTGTGRYYGSDFGIYSRYYRSGGSSGAAAPGQFPGGGGAGAGEAGTSGADGADGAILLTYVVAPGPSPYPVAGSAAYWYGYEASGTYTGLSLEIEADGVSDYAITVQAATVTVTGSYGRVASLAIGSDGYQLDAINLAPSSATSKPTSGWTYYTSGAQGTTLPAGNHTITFTATRAQFTGPAWIRVDQVLG